MTDYDQHLQALAAKRADDEEALTDVLDDAEAMESFYVSIASEWPTVAALVEALDLGHVDQKEISNRVLAMAQREADRRSERVAEPSDEDFDDIVSPATADYYNRLIRAATAA
jgi:hypothetical protein